MELSNGNFEEWNEYSISGLLNGAEFWNSTDLTGGCPVSWTCVNSKTFVKEANISSTYNTVPSTLKCEGKDGMGVRLRTVGWDNGAGNSAITLLLG